MAKSLKINHVTVLVSDKERAEKFYTEVLGLEKFEVGKSLWIKIGDQNQFIHITDNSGEPKPNTFYHFAIEFDDFKNFIKSVIDKGVDVFDLGKERNKHSVNTNLDNQGRQFFVLDYDGNMIELVSAGEKFFNPQ